LSFFVREGALEKPPEAFRTISEVANELTVPKHVLRFWEAKFPQIKPMKRGGGRRYYRPEHVALLKGIRLLLYEDGYTIRGVQKILREQGLPFLMEQMPYAKERENHQWPSEPEIPDVAAEATKGTISRALEMPSHSADIGVFEAIMDEMQACVRILTAARK
jgi:DNA-binding transcriptional MerR regulator